MSVQRRQDELIEELTGTKVKQSKRENIPMAELTANETVDINAYNMVETDDSTSEEETPVSLDRYENVLIDREELNKDQADLYLPTGDYIWRDRKMSVRIKEEDTSSKDIDKKGRTTFSWFGKVESKDGSTEGVYYLTVSPDKRNRLVDGRPGKEPDTFYKNYLAADRLFFQVNERNAERFTEIIAFLDKEMYYMNITRGKNGGNFFQSFKKVS